MAANESGNRNAPDKRLMLQAVAGVRITERVIPIPQTVSPEAQAAFASVLSLPTLPRIHDHAGWRDLAAHMNAQWLPTLQRRAARADAVTDIMDVDGVAVYATTPTGLPAGNEKYAYLYVHGGAHVMGAGECCKLMSRFTAAETEVPTYAVDYRMPPDHPYPTAVEDCLTAYRALLRERAPSSIVIGGISAGGNVAAATVLRARDEGLPLPAGLVLLTPEVDLTESGDSFYTHRDIDVMLKTPLAEFINLYARNHDLRDPYLSPLFGDFTRGFPRTFLQTGTRDLFLSNTVRMHRALRRANVPVELHVFEAMPHGGFGGLTPEDAELSAEVRRFVHECLQHSLTTTQEVPRAVCSQDGLAT